MTFQSYLGKSLISLTEKFGTVCLSEQALKTALVALDDLKNRKPQGFKTGALLVFRKTTNISIHKFSENNS